jgi:hypothetical protein
MEYLILMAMFLAPPVAFIFCLINAIRHIIKYKKGEEGKTKAVVYSIVTGAAFTYLIAEALLVIWLAEGIAHM